VAEPQKPVRPLLWTVIGAIVGAFLMPSTWLLLVAVSVGGQLANTVDTLTGTSEDFGGDPAGQIDPDTGAFTLDPGAESPTANTPVPWWIIAGLIVAMVATVLSSVFFGWLGRRAAHAHNARLASSVQEVSGG
jgi:hypothetical protein